jgi:hypothetical protein
MKGSAKDVPDAVVQFLTAEHFALQGARGTTIAEVNGRQQSYLGVLSSVILALAFIAQVTEMGSTFFASSLVLLPVVYFIGLTTIERIHQIWGEWLLYQIGINRIRHYYVEAAPELERFVLPTTDDPSSSLEPFGIFESRWRWALGVGGTIGVINSVVAGVLAGLTAQQLGSPAAVSWIVGVPVFAVSLWFLRSVMLRFWTTTRS